MSSNIQDFNTLLSQGTKLLHQGRSADALPYLKKAHDLEPKNIDAGINLSGAYILTKKFKKAKDVLEPLTDRFPNHSLLWINLGAAYLGNPVLARSEDQDRAISAFKRALEIDPVAPSVAYNIGLVYRDRGDDENAIFWFAQALRHNPDDNDAQRLIEKIETK